MTDSANVEQEAPITPDMAIRRAFYAILMEATTGELEAMIYGMRTGKLPIVPSEYRRAG